MWYIPVFTVWKYLVCWIYQRGVLKLKSIKISVQGPFKPVLNWASVCSRNQLEVFSEPSWFLIGQTFLHEPSLEYLSKVYLGSQKLHSTCSGNIRPIRRTLPLIGWEQSSPVDEEEIKIKMDDGVTRFFTRFGGNLFICWLVGGAALSWGPQNEIVVSWITLWGMIKV